jgi:hypothetical protein
LVVHTLHDLHPLTPSEQVERLVDSQPASSTHGDQRLREAAWSPTHGNPLSTTSSSGGAPIRSTSLRALADQGLVMLNRPRRIDVTEIGPGDTPIIRPHDISVDFRATPSEYIDRTSLPRSVELTRPGDVPVVTGGRVRAGVDFDGGAVVVGAIQIIRPTALLH